MEMDYACMSHFHSFGLSWLSDWGKDWHRVLWCICKASSFFRQCSINTNISFSPYLHLLVYFFPFDFFCKLFPAASRLTILNSWHFRSWQMSCCNKMKFLSLSPSWDHISLLQHICVTFKQKSLHTQQTDSISEDSLGRSANTSLFYTLFTSVTWNCKMGFSE